MKANYIHSKWFSHWRKTLGSGCCAKCSSQVHFTEGTGSQWTHVICWVCHIVLSRKALEKQNAESEQAIRRARGLMI